MGEFLSNLLGVQVGHVGEWDSLDGRDVRRFTG